MGYKTLEITRISASGLKNVNFIGKMDVYVVVSLSGDPRNKQKTRVHQDGGTSPYWDQTLSFTVDEATALKDDLKVVFHLKHENAFGRDNGVGEVRVPVKELLNNNNNNRESPITTYKVHTPSGRFKGELKFSYKATDAIGTSAGNVRDWWNMDGKVITINDSHEDNWEDKSKSIKSSNCNYLVVMEFSAQWCGPSRFIRPFIEKLADANKNVLFLSLIYDSMEDVASEESVDVVPTFLLYKGGELKQKIVGARRFDLFAKINELK